MLQRRLFHLKQRFVHAGLEQKLELMRRHDGMSREQFREARDELIREALAAAARTPYYREIFSRHGVEPTDAESIERAPLLTRAETQSRTEEMLDPAVDRATLRRMTTSGSTGTKAVFYRSPESLRWGYAVGERGKEWWGLDLAARTIRVWGRSFEYKHGSRERLRGRLSNLKDRAIGTLPLSANDLSLAEVERSWPQILRWQPKRIHGYASAIYLIARFVNESGIDGRALGLDSVIVESEMCYPFQRTAIEQAFGCPVLAWYGCVETGVIATPCREGRLHVREDVVHLEVVDSAIVLTTLREPAMPLIRYVIGDEGRLDPAPCPCGLPSRVLAELTGRTPDMLRRLDGSFFPGHVLTHVFDQYPGIRRFKLTQKAVDRIRVEIECVAPLEDDPSRQLISQLQKMFGGEISVDLEQVPEIRPEASGKFRWVVNEMGSPAAQGRS